MAGEKRDGIFGTDRPTDKRPEDYQPPSRPRAGEDIPLSEDEADEDDGQDATDRTGT